MKKKSQKLFGEILVEDGIINQSQLDEALQIQNEQNEKSESETNRLGVILGRLGYLDKPTLEKYINKIIKTYFS